MQEKNYPYRVLLLEINEISWSLMERFLQEGMLPNFSKLRKLGVTASTITAEPKEFLEPWITWTTLLSGVPQTVHGVKFLEQPHDTIKAPRVWDLADQAGLKVGVFGSAGSWPPKRVKGFFVPGSFSPDTQTYPESLAPIQELNLRYTRAHAPGAKQPGLKDSLNLVLKSFKLGLDIPTLITLATRLAGSKLKKHADWKKVSLQPVLNRAFFSKQFRVHRPDFATFHTNHVAHYQHRFFRAWKPELFQDATDPAEVERFRDSIAYGYRTSDELLGEFMDLCDREGVILCVASSMGQQPFIPERHANVAPETVRIKSIEHVLEIIGIRSACEFFSTMAPQWNIRIADEAIRRKAILDLTSARHQPLDKPMYSVLEVKDTLVLTPISRHGLGEGVTCVFPTLPGSPSFPFAKLFLQADETRKSGCHHPVGMLGFYGKQVGRGVELGQIDTLDIAPTLLELLGLPRPASMTGVSRAASVAAIPASTPGRLRSADAPGEPQASLRQ